MKPRTRSSAPAPSLAPPPHWSPEQALALWECLELLREQLWLAYGPQIQCAWRNQLVPRQLTLPVDPSEPF